MLPDADRVTEAEGEGEGDVDRVALVVTVTLGVKLGDAVRLVVGVGLRDVDGVTAKHHQNINHSVDHTHTRLPRECFTATTLHPPFAKHTWPNNSTFTQHVFEGSHKHAHTQPHTHVLATSKGQLRPRPKCQRAQ
jgi:hypothetical protein